MQNNSLLFNDRLDNFRWDIYFHCGALMELSDDDDDDGQQCKEWYHYYLYLHAGVRLSFVDKLYNFELKTQYVYL